ncbi:MAG: HAMP domain-containing histidine kinase [Bacteroides sp.]|nr:HAMP domain-containing histidine kinase [Bacteroides sp.]MCM1413630.1 HAMP domain-containing histidine kinase [Bacteroides sp.]MCM1471153.1 HAMP domain-containing histidine kinase [Bacteroides sp.]
MKSKFRQYRSLIFLVITLMVVGAFLYVSNRIVKDLATQERARMQIWADATRQLASLGDDDADLSESNIDFLFGIIEDNDNIPVLLTDRYGSIIQQRNFRLPEPDADIYSGRNADYLESRLKALRTTDNQIDIEIGPGDTQHLYYDDSTLLRRLSYYPYIQLAVMGAFIFVVYYAVASSKRAEQNKVWVGLSKETAHQLGTPISSLMAWIELMRDTGVDPMMVDDMDKDVKRLSTIASRFSKIGSQPQIESADLNGVVSRAVEYMSRRISSRISLTVEPSAEPLFVDMSEPLIEWVMENLIKNAVDAMDGSGSIDIVLRRHKEMAVITVADTGKGMTRKMRKEVFRPGFTTKKRGWGLGLTLARRIIGEYHSGRIFVSASEPGRGTTFEIDLPLS